MNLLAGALIPAVIIAAGSVGKKLVHKEPWCWEHTFFGIELSVAAFADAMLGMGDMIKDLPAAGNVPITVVKQLLIIVGFIVFDFMMFLFLLSTHQDWEKKKCKSLEDRQKRVLMLAGISNLIGFVLLASRMFFLK